MPPRVLQEPGRSASLHTNESDGDLWEPRGVTPGATRRSGSFGRVRTARYRTALGSARETLACLRVAEAFGYVEPVAQTVQGKLDRVIGTLVRVAT